MNANSLTNKSIYTAYILNKPLRSLCGAIPRHDFLDIYNTFLTAGVQTHSPIRYIMLSYNCIRERGSNNFKELRTEWTTHGIRLVRKKKGFMF
jgi:hypothetical protein